MEVSAYPRPSNDNGRGIHWFPSVQQPRELIDAFVAELAAMHMRWTVVVGQLDPPFGSDYMVRSLVGAGISPIMTFTKPDTTPMSRRELGRFRTIVRHYVNLSVHYFQLYYEPNSRAAWSGGKLPEDVVSRSLEAWLPAAGAVIEGGGLPGLFPLAARGEYPGGDLRFLQDTLAQLVQKAPEEILERMWLALHNYNLGHPPNERSPDSHCFLKFLWYDQIVRRHLQGSLPILSTEGGPRAGPAPLGDGASEETVADWTVWCYNYLLKEAPDYYFSLCPWILGNAIGGGKDPRWESAAWFRRDGSHQPVVEAVKAMPPGPRSAGKGQETRERYFPETNIWVREPFVAFLEEHGVGICGLPLTEAILEGGHLCQYFENLALEEYGPGQVKPKHLGRDFLGLKRGTNLPGAIKDRAGGLGFPPPTIVELHLPSLPTPQRGKKLRPREEIDQIAIRERSARLPRGAKSWQEYLLSHRDSHFFIITEGTIYQLNLLEDILGSGESWRQGAVEVSLAGSIARAPEAQLESLARLLLWLMESLGIEVDDIHDAGELTGKKPRGRRGRRAAAWREILMRQIREELETQRRFFPETGFTVSGAFLSFLERRGLEVTGYPLSDVSQEELPTQYFQHMVLEEYQLGKARPRDIGAALLARQQARALPSPGPSEQPQIVDLSQQLPHHARLEYNKRAIEKVELVVIHHSGTSEPLTPEALAEYHVSELGWPGIGYHFYIPSDGSCLQTNSPSTTSFHAGAWNEVSVGVCLAGNFHQAGPSQAQLATAEKLCAWLLEELQLDEEAFKGHGDLVGSDCPGHTWFAEGGWQEFLRQGIRRRLAAGREE